MHFRQSNLHYVIENLAFMAGRNFDAKYKGQWRRTRRVHHAASDCKLKILCICACVRLVYFGVCECARESQCLYLLRYDGVFFHLLLPQALFLSSPEIFINRNKNNGHCEPPLIRLAFFFSCAVHKTCPLLHLPSLRSPSSHNSCCPAAEQSP